MRRPAPLPAEPTAAPAAADSAKAASAAAASASDATAASAAAASAAASAAAASAGDPPPATNVPPAQAADPSAATSVPPRAPGRPAPLAPLAPPTRRPGEGPGHPASDGRSPSDVASEAAPTSPAGSIPDVDPVVAPPADHPDALADGIGVREVWAAARARRRALRAEVRRFTVRQRRRRMLWIGIVGALALLVLGSVGAAYSPLFAVERIDVEGTSTLDASAVEAALAGQLGTPLPRVDPSAVKAALVQFPLVESYTLEARPPHDLVVRIVERTPIGSIQSAAGYTLVDAAGVGLATTPEPAAGHPVITATGGVGSNAFTAIGTVFRSLPDDIRSQVTAMSATTANDVTLTFGGTGTEVVWGNADDSAFKAVVLAKAMAALPPEHVYSYDVSSPDAVVVR